MSHAINSAIKDATHRPTQKIWVLTEARIERIEFFAKKGLSMTATAGEMNVHQRTLRAAADRENRTKWLNNLFPTKSTLPTKCHKRNLSPTEMSSLRLLASTTAWTQKALGDAFKKRAHKKQEKAV